jgi:ribosomal protein S12 methylthiotransferase
VDSDKLTGLLGTQGYSPAASADDADLVVVNTCAFIESAREESIDVVLQMADVKKNSARLVVTGCMAERYGDELAEALPEVDLVAGFGQNFSDATPVALGATRRSDFDLLNLPRPATTSPWAYVKIAEGCDRRCGFCAIPTFRGDQRSRSIDDIVREASELTASGVKEIVLIAQDLASWGNDRRRHALGEAVEVLDVGGTQPLVDLTLRLTKEVERLRLLYLYPSGLTERLIEAILATNVPYFDLSLQHVSRAHLRRMNRWGDGERFLERIEAIRAVEPNAAFRSSFILGYPGETEDDHTQLLEFLTAAQLDWAGFFPYSAEQGTAAASMPDQVPPSLALERLREVSDVQDTITARRRDEMVGREYEILMDSPGVGRTVKECPEIDGVVYVSSGEPVGTLVRCRITGSRGTDLEAEVL